MAEDIEWIPPGFAKEEKAWEKALKDFPPNHELFQAARKAGINLRISVKKSGSRYYVVLIKDR